MLGPVAATSVGQSPQIVAASRAGTPYVYALDGSNNNINRIDESSGQQVLFAGNGASGSSADGSIAAGAALQEPCGLAVDEAGNVYIEEAASRVRIVPASTGTLFGQAMSAGHIYTVAGTGVPGFAGDGGPASSAQFDARAFFAPPGQIAVDAEGDLAIADSFDNRVRFVPAKSATYYGRAMSAGDIYTLAGTGEAAFGGDGGAAGEAKLSEPLGVGFDSLNNLAIGDTQNARVRFVSASSKSQFGQSMTAGAIYTIAGNGKQEYAGEGVAATGGGLQFPDGVAFDALGDLLLAETNGARVRAVARVSGNLFGTPRTAGDIYTIAGDGSFGFSGDGGIAGGAQISSADSVAIDHSANLLIADGANNRVRLVPSSSGPLFGAFREPDHIYTVAGNGSAGFSGDGGPATASELATPVGVAVAPHGGFAVADFFNNRIRFVSAGEDLFGQAMSAEDMYTLAGNGTGAFGGDGGPGTSAELSEPEGVAFDAAGDLAIADRFNHRVRFVPATSGTYFGQAISAAHIYTIAGSGKAGFSGDGGPGPAAELHEPTSVAFDAAGDLFIADSENQRARFLPATSGTYFGRAMIAAHIYTIAGNGKAGFSGDGGPASAAELQNVSVGGRRRGRRRRDRRPRQLARALRAGRLGQLLRPGDERRAHLHDRRQRRDRIRRRRRPGDGCGTRTRGRCARRRRGRRDRRRAKQSRAAARRARSDDVRDSDARRRHLHDRRQRCDRLWRRWRRRHRGIARRTERRRLRRDRRCPLRGLRQQPRPHRLWRWPGGGGERLAAERPSAERHRPEIEQSAAAWGPPSVALALARGERAGAD